MPTTIQLEEATRRRLARLKVGGLTYDDVVAKLLDGVDEEAFRKAILEWGDDMAARIRRNPKNKRVM